VRCGRSLQGYPFNPCLTEAQYKEMEEKVSSTLSGLEGELKGQFYPLTGMTKEVQQKLIDDHFLFKEGDRFLQVGVILETLSQRLNVIIIITLIIITTIGMEELR
jgi:protein-arginine kinase